MDGLAREARNVEERKTWIEKEDLRLAKVISEEADRESSFFFFFFSSWDFY
jgi:hypothetical protein